MIIFGKQISRKNLIISGIILCLAAIITGGGLYYYFSEIKDEDEDSENEPKKEDKEVRWKVYQNEAGGYSYMYPSNWTIETGEGSLSKYSYFKPQEETGLEGSVNVDVPVREELNNDYLDYEESLLLDSVKYVDRSEIKVDDAEAMRFLVQGNEYNFEDDEKGDAFRGIRVLIIKDKQVYAISLIKEGEKELSEDYINLFDKIVESFEFQEKITEDEKENTEDTDTVPEEEETPESETAEDGDFIGKITNVYEKNSKNYLDIDYIQFLSGKEAIVAALEDGQCVLYEKGTLNELDTDTELPNLKEMTYEEILANYDQDCTPNDFYIRNQNPKIRTFEISATAFKTATDFAHDPDGVRDLNYNDFKSYYKDYHLYNIEVKNGKIVKVEEQYIP